MADDARDAHGHEHRQQQQQAAAAAAAFHALHSPPPSPPAVAAHLSAAASSADGVNSAIGGAAPLLPRGPYRGKCLYKTGKCPNERALKTSGAAHNLCDEHRRRQNEHQRKLDSKNRTSRRDKRSRTGGFLSDELDAESVAAAVAVAVGESAAAEKRAIKVAAHARAVDAAAKAIALADISPVMMKAIAHPPPVAVGAASVGAPPSSSGAAAAVSSTPAADAKGSILSTGAQPPQMAYPFLMQDFDGVVVPLPSYLEAHERGEFRARIYQKVLDFLSEECIRRFGGKLTSDSSASAPAPSPEPQMRAVNALSPIDAVHTGSYFAAQALQQQQQLAAALATEREKRGGGGASESDDDADDLRDAKKLRGRSARKGTRSEV